MPKALTPTPTQIAWQEIHRCVICNGLPATINTELLEEHRTLKPAYRHMAVMPGPYEPYMTDVIGGEYRTEVECENGHHFVCHYHQFRDKK